MEELPLDSVLALDFRKPLEEVPEEILALLPLFDGRRTLTQVVNETRLPRQAALAVIQTLHRRQIIRAPLSSAESDPEAPELSVWLAPPPRAAWRPKPLQLAVGVAGLLGLIGVAALASHRSAPKPPAVVTPSVVVAPPPVVVVAPVPPPVVVAPAPPPPVVAAAPVVAPAPPPADDYQPLVDEGRHLYAQGRVKQAAAALQKALAAKPDGEEALVALAKCHLDQGANAKALAESQQASKLNDRNADAWLVIGTVQQQNGRANDARNAYKKYLELAPKGQYAGEIRSVLRSL